MPEYVNEIQNTKPFELESTLDSLVSLALTTQPKDKDLAIVKRYQQKYRDTLLQRSTDRLHSLRSEKKALGEKLQSTTDDSEKLTTVELQGRVKSLVENEETSDEEEVTRNEIKNESH